jgi:ribonuclease I
MRITYIIIILIIVIICDGEYYELVLQNWCNKSTYNIHGLWLNYDNNSYPQYCKKTSYTQPKSILLEEMNQYWDNCGNKDYFWKHEWFKHGTCTNMTEEIFFNNVIRLYKNFSQSYITNICKYSKSCIIAYYDLLLNKYVK